MDTDNYNNDNNKNNNSNNNSNDNNNNENNTKDMKGLEEMQEAFWRLNSAVRVNIMQIRRYLETYHVIYLVFYLFKKIYYLFMYYLSGQRYSTISHSFPRRILDDLDDKIQEADTLFKEFLGESKIRRNKNEGEGEKERERRTIERKHEEIYYMYAQIQQEVIILFICF